MALVAHQRQISVWYLIKIGEAYRCVSQKTFAVLQDVLENNKCFLGNASKRMYMPLQFLLETRQKFVFDVLQVPYLDPITL